MTTDSAWNAHFGSRHPCFDALAAASIFFRHFSSWPSVDDYQLFLAHTSQGQATLATQPLRVINQLTGGDAVQHYELFIRSTGQLPTRLHNWHDFFQICVWGSFARSKVALNARHAAATERRLKNGAKLRAADENAATIFDENGAIIVASREELLGCVRELRWRELFVDRRELCRQHLRCFVFGHALYEKFLHPYIGLTAHTLLLTVTDDFFAQTRDAQLLFLDAWLAKHLEDEHALQSPRSLAPFPVLGIPGWDPRNEHEAFYDNTQYFRSIRRGR